MSAAWLADGIAGKQAAGATCKQPPSRRTLPPHASGPEQMQMIWEISSMVASHAAASTAGSSRAGSKAGHALCHWQHGAGELARLTAAGTAAECSSCAPAAVRWRLPTQQQCRVLRAARLIAWQAAAAAGVAALPTRGQQTGDCHAMRLAQLLTCQLLQRQTCNEHGTPSAQRKSSGTT